MTLPLKRSISRRELFGLPRGSAGHSYALIGPECLTFHQIACESCAEVCEHDAIRFARVGAIKQASIDLELCTACEACIPRCPVGALSIVHPDPEKA